MKRKKKKTKEERKLERASQRPLRMNDEMIGIMEKQLQAFREKFGRDPGPNDPIFFDPDADEPRPFNEEQLREMQADFLNIAQTVLRPESAKFVEENYDRDATFECPNCEYEMVGWALASPICPECGFESMQRTMVIVK